MLIKDRVLSVCSPLQCILIRNFISCYIYTVYICTYKKYMLIKLVNNEESSFVFWGRVFFLLKCGLISRMFLMLQILLEVFHAVWDSHCLGLKPSKSCLSLDALSSLS